MKLLGAVLAGGTSSRFGSDKALARLDGRTLLEHAIAQLHHFTETIVIVGHDHAGLIGLPDLPCAGLGPLGGLNAALAHAEAGAYDAVLTVPCDAPSLTPEDLRALLVGGAAAFARLPVCGVWPVALAPRLRHHLASGGSRSMRGWIEASGVRLIDSERPIANINHASDLTAYSLTRAPPH